jgi:hypothetical protein
MATGQETAAVPSDHEVWMCERVISKQGFCFYLTTLRFALSPQQIRLSTPGSKIIKGEKMIRKTEDELKQLEGQYPGITEQIWRFEQADLPVCPVCGSEDTASVQVGVMGRTINIGASTTKIHLMLNVNGKGMYYCNNCKRQFD